jgi:hypothetical protein
VIDLSRDDLRDATALLQAIERELAGTLSVSANGDSFLFYDPDRVTVPERRFPFLTLVTGDRYDRASNLDRDARTYRVNLGVDRQAYEDLLGPAPRQPAGYDVVDTGCDYTDVDVVLPHPFYAPLHWVCIVNPAERTRAHLGQLLLRSHALARRRYQNRRRL